MYKSFLRGAAVVAALIFLSACDTAEERAEKHYQAALEHLESGDFERAAIEFRNVFKLNGKHKEARLAYANMRRDTGHEADAYSQYLRLVEQFPDHFEGRRALARLATLGGDWDEVERHIEAAAEQKPDDPVVRAILTSLAYRDAILAGDGDAANQAAQQASALSTEASDLLIPYNIIVDNRIRQQQWNEALSALDKAIAATPETRSFYDIRLGVLNELGEADRIGALLEEMVQRFPEDEEVQNRLVAWYMSRDDLGATEAFLRKRIDPAENDPQNRMILLRFLTDTRGPEVTIAEIDKMLTGDLPHAPLFQALRAGLVFDNGDQSTAISELETLVETSEPSADLNDAKLVLARMLFDTDNPVGARALVEEVLTDDPSHTNATKIKAGWLIEDDHTGDAIVLLRAALGDSPQDAGLMTLLARAHERDGNRDLMAEMLSLAVEASGRSPETSLSYANYLAGEGRNNHAESVLIEALSVRPNHVPMLVRLGQIYIAEQNWNRVQGIIDALQTLGDDASQQANALTAGLMSAQGRQDALLDFLENLPDAGGHADYTAEIAIIRTHVRDNNLEAALEYLDRSLAEAPQDPVLQFLQASILAGAGETEQAANIYRALLKEQPQAERIWIALHLLYKNNGELAKADQTLEDALNALPDSSNLKWMQAIALEIRGDIDGAIAIYEDLYELNSASPVIANNLASLLSTHLDDNESLERAYRIARRLRDSPVPQFRDTYGWIVYRRGDYDDALFHLEPAAEDLLDDPRVLYHLGATYAALGHTQKARETLTQAAEEASDLPALEQKIQDTITNLANPPN